jgi:predicted nucleic acid-binding Zn ribbon protein
MLDNGSPVPFYEYRRQDGTTFEIMQKMVDPPLECDPETGLPVTRVFHPIAVHFKGKGFYNTDYGTKKRAREKDAHESSKKSSESGDSSAGGDAAKGETKSDGAAKSEASSSSSSSSDASSSSSAAAATPAKPAKPAKS